MPDNIIPEAQVGEGPAPRGGYGGAPDYRRIQAPEQVNTDIPNSGAAARAAELGNVFKEFEGIGANVYGKIQTQAGALAGAASGATGHPDYKTGVARFTAYSQAFNNAATGAYAVQAEAQADDAAARLRIQANNNPATFAATYSAARDAVLKQAPPLAVPMLTEMYNKRLANGLAAITGDQLTEQRNTQRQAYDVGVAKQISRVANLQGSPDPTDQAAAADEHVKLTLLIDGGVNAGLYSQAEAQAMHISSMRAITAQVFESQLNREFAGPDGAMGAVRLLENFRQAHIDNLSDPNAPPILSEDEYQKLYADATTKLREYNLGEAAVKRDGKTAEQMKFEAGDKNYTSMFLQGKLTDRLLDMATQNGDLKPEVARTLHNQLAGGAPAKSNGLLLYNLHNDPNMLNFTPADIGKYIGPGGITGKDGEALMAEIDRRNNGWEGTQGSKQAVETISAALKIPAGTELMSLSEDQRKAYIEAHQEYVQLVNGTEPAKRQSSMGAIAQLVIQHAQQREAAADVVALTRNRTGYVTNHGPDSPAPGDEKTYQARLKQYDDQIARAQARAKGQ